MEEEALMFFILSKTVALLILPSNLLIVLGLAGLALMATRWRRAGACMVAASLTLLAVIGFSPLGGLLTQLLENRFPPWDPARGAPDGIVVLGGEISPRLSRERGEPVVSGEAGRIVAMVKLARLYPNARIIYSGGDASLLGNQLPEANFVYPLLDSLGVARERVLLETRSRNTAENAAFTKNLANPGPAARWLLVTSAQHMPRAIGCFRRVGFPVEAYPVGWLTGAKAELTPSAVFSSGLGRFDSAVREWTGLFAYWLSGKTTELLPAP
jgi:uncharacterized SAM-binding protein YcdF (DUF218 family)